jgi:hypothetical protein
MNVMRTLAIGIAVVFLAAGCGTVAPGNGDPPGNGNDEPPPGNDTGEVSQFGFVGMDEFGTSEADRSVVGFGVFIETDMDVPEAFLANPYHDVLGTCEVFSFVAEPPDEGELLPRLPDDLTFTTLDAGDVLTVEAAGGVPYALLPRDEVTFESETFTFYSTEDEIPGGLPEVLTVTIPGAEFPAFTDEELPVAPSFELTAPETTNVEIDTEFAWEPSEAAEAVVLLTVTSIDIELETFLTVTCFAADADGEFVFPSDTVDELGAGFQGTLWTAGRWVFRTVPGDDAALVLSTSSTHEFMILQQPLSASSVD